jgi:hypothetical protein
MSFAHKRSDRQGRYMQPKNQTGFAGTQARSRRPLPRTSNTSMSKSTSASLRTRSPARRGPTSTSSRIKGGIAAVLEALAGAGGQQPLQAVLGHDRDRLLQGTAASCIRRGRHAGGPGRPGGASTVGQTAFTWRNCHVWSARSRRGRPKSWPGMLSQPTAAAAVALRRRVADSPNRKTARALPTLGGVEPLKR